MQTKIVALFTIAPFIRWFSAAPSGAWIICERLTHGCTVGYFLPRLRRYGWPTAMSGQCKVQNRSIPLAGEGRLFYFNHGWTRINTDLRTRSQTEAL